MIYRKFLIVFFLFISTCLCFYSCEKKKEGKVIISEQEFVLRQDKEHSFVVDAKGKLKNVGEVDVKNVVVTGDCKACSEVFNVGMWFVSGTDKMPEQKDTVSYISAGNEEEFNFKGVANIYNQPGQSTPEIPDSLEIIIESFEAVEN